MFNEMRLIVVLNQSCSRGFKLLLRWDVSMIRRWWLGLSLKVLFHTWTRKRVCFYTTYIQACLYL